MIQQFFLNIKEPHSIASCKPKTNIFNYPWSKKTSRYIGLLRFIAIGRYWYYASLYYKSYRHKYLSLLRKLVNPSSRITVRADGINKFSAQDLVPIKSKTVKK